MAPPSQVERCPPNRVNSNEPPAVGIGKEWSDADLTKLGNMLVRGLSIEEIARVLGRDRGEVQDKVVEIGRACREPTAANSEW